jgi:hypothetical protein
LDGIVLTILGDNNISASFTKGEQQTTTHTEHTHARDRIKQLSKQTVISMGNKVSSVESQHHHSSSSNNNNNDDNDDVDSKAKYRSFPGSAILEKTFCGSIDTTDPAEYSDANAIQKLLKRADKLCISSPIHSEIGGGGRFPGQTDDDDEDETNSILQENHDNDKNRRKKKKQSASLFARALVQEVTNNPKTMNLEQMALREKALLKAQQRAVSQSIPNSKAYSSSKPVGTPGPPHMLRSVALACTGDDANADLCVAEDEDDTENKRSTSRSEYSVSIGLCLSRRSTHHGHPATITRQTAYDFNQLQDREYKYVSSTDAYGWRAGGGEDGKHANKKPSPDMIELEIITIDCPSQQVVDAVITALASGEIFIPHMQIMPDARMSSATSADGNHPTPPDLHVDFTCERVEDDAHVDAPDEWNNWCLEFVHNQIYEYFENVGAKWTQRPFQLTLAKSVRWKTVKHMNRYFSHAEEVLKQWRQLGPQYLDPQPCHIEGGATPEEVARPHGIYLFRNGMPTNYFCPNFDPPYTTKMTRSLLANVLSKSWDTKRREWSSHPLPRLVDPGTLFSVACGCGDLTAATAGGYMAREVTAALASPPTTSSQAYPNAPVSPTMRQRMKQIEMQRQHQHLHSKSTPLPPEDEPSILSAMEFGGGDTKNNEAGPCLDDLLEELASEEKKTDEITLLRQQQERQEAQSSSSPTKLPARNRYSTAEEDVLSSANHSSSHGSKSRLRRHPNQRSSWISTGGADESPHYTSSSARGSVAESGTTVLHTNLTKSKTFQNAMAMKNNAGSNTAASSKATLASSSSSSSKNPTEKNNSTKGLSLYCDDDFLNETMSIKSKTEADPPGLRSTTDSTSSSPREASSTKENDDDDDSGINDDNNEGQNDRYQEQPARSLFKPTTQDHNNKKKTSSKSHNMKPSRSYKMSPSPKKNRGYSPHLEQANSGQSLEYSTDGSSYFFNQEQSLIGQHFANDDATATTLGSAAKQPSSSLSEQQQHNHPRRLLSTQEEEDEAFISSSGSNSSEQSEVPTDEDLHAIGWAKALDPNSGNYYYFSLDRTKTMWENPLTWSERGREVQPPAVKRQPDP